MINFNKTSLTEHKTHIPTLQYITPRITRIILIQYEIS
jgi:hypothetical protein